MNSSFDPYAYVLAALDGLGPEPLTGTVARHAPDGHRDAAAALLGGVWSALARPGALATNFRLVESGREIDRSRWMRSRVGDGEVLHTELVPAYLQSAVDRGATLVVSHLDALDGTVMMLREAVEYLLTARAWVNCYITAGTASAFDVHTDDHDALILQLAGRKRWEVDTRIGAGAADLAAGHLDTVLEPGTCLSVPRGTAHRVTGTGELTVHLTVGYEPFADAAAEARRLCTAGTGLPAADRTRLAGRLARRTERRHGVSLPGALTGELRDDARIRWASRFPPTVEHARDGLVITTMDRRFRLDGRLARTVGLLTAGAPLSWSQLCERSDLPAADVRSLVGFGIRHDFLICEG